MQEYISYAESGVDIEEGDRAVSKIKRLAERSNSKGVLSGVGGFASLFRLKDVCADYEDPILVSGTDGVGTKLLVAIAAGKHEWIGQDLVAMCANDVLTVGAKPLFFLDYFATARVKDSPLLEVVESISNACRSIGCALVGGETAEMPGIYAPAHYDLAGFCVGVVDRKQLVDGSKIREGHQIIALHSSGLHSNGFALARQILFERLGFDANSRAPFSDCEETVADLLLRPTRLYVNTIHSLLEEGAPIHGMAHITGGGIVGNLTRCFPDGLGAVIDMTTWQIPPLFRFLETKGPVLPDEMQKTFNLGIGFALVAPKEESRDILKTLESIGETATLIGEVCKGEGVEMVGAR